MRTVERPSPSHRSRAGRTCYPAEEVIERATFDPEWALDDPDVTLLDVGHPLVRRLVEEVKQHAFRDATHYGRTAYLVTPDVKEVTAVFYLL